MAARIIAAGLVAASLLVAPAFAQTTPPAPGHSESTTTITDKKTSDTDKAGKTVTKHHKVVKHHAKSKVKPEASDSAADGNTSQ